MQLIKGASTLRVTPKKEKPSPRVVYKFGEQSHAIANFLKERERIKRIYRSIYFFCVCALNFNPKPKLLKSLVQLEMMY